MSERNFDSVELPKIKKEYPPLEIKLEGPQLIVDLLEGLIKHANEVFDEIGNDPAG